MTALQTPRRSPQEPKRRESLREVPRTSRRIASVPFVLGLAVLLAVGMVGLLLLNTALQEQAFAVRDQQKAADLLGYRVSALESEVTEARSSSRLAIEAAKLGMVPNTYPVYLQLPAGTITGNPTKMTGNEVPDIRYRTPEQLEKIAKAREKAAAEAAAEAKAAAKAAKEAKKKAAEKAKQQAEAAKKKAAEAKKKAEEARKQADAAKKKAEQDAKNKKKNGDR